MKIGINARFLGKPMTGIGQVTTNFLKELARLHIPNDEYQNSGASSKLQDVRFVLYCQEPPQLDFEFPANFETRVFLPWWKRADRLREWLWERQLARDAATDDCDVFFSLYQSATTFPSSQPIRHVMLVHDLIPLLFPEYVGKWSDRLHYRAIQQAIRQATHILTPSQTTKDDIVRLLGVARESITPVSLGVEPRFFERLSEADLTERLKRYSLTSGYLYHGGGLERRKDTESLLEAYAELVRRRTADLPPLVISGQVHAESNPLATPVRSLIEKLGLGDRVTLVGLVPPADLPALYQGAAIFIFPSRYEGFGLPVLEAYASGVPVITTRSGSLSELVTEETALIISEGEGKASALARAMETLLRDGTMRERLVMHGRSQAAKYRWERFAETVVAHLVQ